MDESDADDGALFAFWAFVERRRRHHHPVDVDTLAAFLEAVADFEAQL